MLRALAIDFNSYFASVEQQERPEPRGKPVLVVPVLAETTGAIAVSLEARQLGLRGGRHRVGMRLQSKMKACQRPITVRNSARFFLQ